MPTLKKLTRDQLNDKALKLGIDPVGMKNRATVIEAIEEAKRDDRPEARVVSVFGNGLRVMVEMHVDRALEEFGDEGLANAGTCDVVDATERELGEIRKRDRQVADSALAAAAVQMAYELDHPYNSATAKANCASELHKAMDRLRELAPPDSAGKKGAVDEVKEKRERRKGRAAA